MAVDVVGQGCMKRRGRAGVEGFEGELGKARRTKGKPRKRMWRKCGGRAVASSERMADVEGEARDIQVQTRSRYGIIVLWLAEYGV
jgi:hypothetical protein